MLTEAGRSLPSACPVLWLQKGTCYYPPCSEGSLHASSTLQSFVIDDNGRVYPFNIWESFPLTEHLQSCSCLLPSSPW